MNGINVEPLSEMVDSICIGAFEAYPQKKTLPKALLASFP